MRAISKDGLLSLLCVVLAAACAHLPGLEGGLLGWDDRRALVDYSGWQGFAWKSWAYDFTTTDMGMYRPLTWLSYAVDHALTGMEPWTFHQTNWLLHLAVSGLLFLVLLRWTEWVAPSATVWPATLATLAFSLHPLRVQVVAWVSARADALAAVFLLLASLAWLAWLRRASRAGRVGWHLLFAASLLAKPVALGAPIAWWLGARWLRPSAPRPRLDLGVGLALSAAVSVPLLMAKRNIGGGGVPHLPAKAAFTALHNAVFPLWKTLVPTRLGYYEPAYPFVALALPYLLGAGVAIALAALLWRARHRVPGLTTTAGAYLALLAPVLGIIPFGYELVADRFSYIPALVLSVGLATLLATGPAWLTRPAALAVSAGALIALGALTWRQSHVWRDTETFWRHNHALFPDSGMANAGMGDVMLSWHRIDEARGYYLRAVQLQPAYIPVYLGLGFIDLVEHRPGHAIPKLELYLSSHPENRRALVFLREAYAAAGRDEDAQAAQALLDRR